MKSNYTPQKQFLKLMFLLLLSNISFGQCWSKVATGRDYIVAIVTNNSFWAWKLNNVGQLKNVFYASSNNLFYPKCKRKFLNLI